MQALLAVALDQHRRGELSEAARHYRTILEGRPEDPDANHLLGLVALQRGEPARASQLIGRAVALAPRQAVFHGNLAEAFRLMGLPDRAIAAPPGRRWRSGPTFPRRLERFCFDRIA